MSIVDPPSGPVPVPQDPEQVLITIGDIHVTPHWVVTPSGTASLSGAQWFLVDQSRTERKIPTWAIVVAIVFALACLLGLLFLLVKEEVTVGYVQVSVRAGDLTHTTHIPVTSRVEVARMWSLLQQVQALTVQAG
jgi:hypothetical protein